MKHQPHITASSTVARIPHALFAEVDDEVLIMNTEAGLYHGLNDIGADVWRRLTEPVKVADLCSELAAKYDGAPDDIERDVLGLLGQLDKRGLIEVHD